MSLRISFSLLVVGGLHRTVAFSLSRLIAQDFWSGRGEDTYLSLSQSQVLATVFLQQSELVSLESTGTKPIEGMHKIPVQSPPPATDCPGQRIVKAGTTRSEQLMKPALGLPFLLPLCQMSRHMADKSCQRSASCWERWHPEVIFCHVLNTLS